MGEVLALTEEEQPPPLCRFSESEKSKEVQFSGGLLKQKLHMKTLFKAIQIKERGQNPIWAQLCEKKGLGGFSDSGELVEKC